MSTAYVYNSLLILIVITTWT